MDYRYYAFIDVLGYRTQLNHDQNNGSDDFLTRLKGAFSILDNIDSAKFQIRSVSDSIFVFPFNNTSDDFIELLKILKSLYFSFLKNKLLIRGGVAYDKHFQTDRIIYSMALVGAYDLESKQAITPRILIANSIIDKAINEGWIKNVRDQNLVLSDGNQYQLHVIADENWDDFYSDAKALTNEAETSQHIPAEVRIKYIWLEDYLFAFKPKGKKRKRYISRWRPV